jgi:hypothetical protein
VSRTYKFQYIPRTSAEDPQDRTPDRTRLPVRTVPLPTTKWIGTPTETDRYREALTGPNR